MKSRYMARKTKKIASFLLILVLITTLISGSLFANTDERRHGWVQIGHSWYLYYNNVRLTGWQPVGRTWFYMDPITGVRQTGWITVGGERFFLDETGAMQTGWITINGIEHEFGTNGVWVGIRPVTSSTSASAAPAFNMHNMQNMQNINNLPPNEENILRRPIAVTLNNARQALPQHSISQADIIYETLVEGGMTRMLAIFNDIRQIGEIGSIRSARPYFVDIVESHDAIFVHGGGSPQAIQEIEHRNICSIDGVFGPGIDAFYRVQQRAHIHSLFTTGERITLAMTSLGMRMSHTEGFRSSPIFAHDGVSSLVERREADEVEDQSTISATDNESPQGPPSGSGEATEVSVRFSGSNTTTFRHNVNYNRYAVSHHDDVWYIDGNNNVLVSVTNIIIIRTDISAIPYDGAGRLAIATTGSGTGYFVNSGLFTEITWSRDSSGGFMYTLPDGTPLRLGWGQTYICIIPLDAQVTIR